MFKKLLILINVALFVGIIWLLFGYSAENSPNQELAMLAANAVTQEGDQQVIKILARGGYNPSEISALANKKTTLKIETKGTYDCSSSISIPALNYRKNLPTTGVTTVEIPAEKTNSPLDILCGMGMFKATINFK